MNGAVARTGRSSDARNKTIAVRFITTASKATPVMTRIIIRIIFAASTSLLVGCASMHLQPTKAHTQPPVTARTLTQVIGHVSPEAPASRPGTAQERWITTASMRGRAHVIGHPAF